MLSFLLNLHAGILLKCPISLQSWHMEFLAGHFSRQLIFVPSDECLSWPQKLQIPLPGTILSGPIAPCADTLDWSLLLRLVSKVCRPIGTGWILECLGTNGDWSARFMLLRLVSIFCRPFVNGWGLDFMDTLLEALASEPLGFEISPLLGVWAFPDITGLMKMLRLTELLWFVAFFFSAPQFSSLDRLIFSINAMVSSHVGSLSSSRTFDRIFLSKGEK